MQEITETTNQPQNRLSFGVVILILSLLLLGIGIAIIGKNLWLNYSAETESIKNKIAALSQQQQLISELQQKLDRSNATPVSTLDPVKDAYLLARMAEDRLQYASDIATAQQLLQLAQDQLANMNDPVLVNIRNILSADQQKLQTFNSPDLQEVQAKLFIIDELSKGLPTKSIVVADATPTPTPQTEVKTTKQKISFDKEWKQAWDKIMDNLKSVVKVKKRNDVNVSVSNLNTEINQAQFKLLVEQIKWAVFYKDSVVYERSIASAQGLIGQVYDINNDEVKKLADALQYLSKVKIQSEVPSICGSVNALQAILVG